MSDKTQTTPDTTTVEEAPLITINTDRIKRVGKKTVRYGRLALVVAGVGALAGVGFILANQSSNTKDSETNDHDEAVEKAINEAVLDAMSSSSDESDN